MDLLIQINRMFDEKKNKFKKKKKKMWIFYKNILQKKNAKKQFKYLSFILAWELAFSLVLDRKNSCGMKESKK